MPKKTYTTGSNSEGQLTFTTYKVWTERSGNHTFPTLELAKSWHKENEGERLDKIVTTIIMDGWNDI